MIPPRKDSHIFAHQNYHSRNVRQKKKHNATAKRERGVMARTATHAHVDFDKEEREARSRDGKRITRHCSRVFVRLDITMIISQGGQCARAQNAQLGVKKERRAFEWPTAE